jgi:hypothetical protein
MSRARRALEHLIPPRGWIIPTSPTLRQALPKIEGTYQMSSKEATSLLASMALLVAPLGFVAGSAWSRFDQSGRNADVAVVAFLVALIILIVLWVLPRLTAKYEFSDGFIAKVSRRGNVRWRENLFDVPRVVLCRDNFNTYITLRWPDRRRSFLVPNSLAKAIEEVQAAIDAPTESERTY